MRQTVGHVRQFVDSSGTASLIRAFQAECGLNQDGVVGAETWKCLSLTVKHGLSSLLERGSASKRKVQRLLKLSGRCTDVINVTSELRGLRREKLPDDL